MQSVQLIRSPLWERRDIDVEKLGQLVWSMMEGGWAVGHPIHYRKVGSTNEIVWGHRRTLSWVLANSISADTLEELIAELKAMAVTTTTGFVCPMCGTDVTNEMEVCPGCNVLLFSDDDGFLGVEGEISVPNPHHFIDNYNEIIHFVDVEIPAEEVVLTDDLSLQLSMLGDNMGRDDVVVVGMVLSVARAVTLGATTKQIGALGIGQSEMQYYVAAAGVPTEILELIRDGAIALSIPFHITTLPVGPQRQAIYDIIVDRESVTVASVKEMVRKIKAFVPPSVSMEDSPRVVNLKKITCAYIDDIDQVVLWKLVAVHGDVPTASLAGAITLDMMEGLGLTCETCPLNGKMIAIKNLAGAYPCQADQSYANGCLMHSEQVYADFNVADRAMLKYADNTSWFENYDLALEAYGAIVEPVALIDEDTRPIDGQRKIIQTFISGCAEASGSEHSYATICANCKYHLTASPTKDVTVPWCEWAVRRSRVSMGYLVDEKAYRIPRCYQYAPIASPLGIVPDTSPGALYNLDGLISQLHARLQVHSEPALTVLTGVPLGSSIPFADWFGNMMKELSFTDKQKATIVMWLLFELQLSSGKAPLALREGRVGSFKFIPITP